MAGRHDKEDIELEESDTESGDDKWKNIEENQKKNLKYRSTSANRGKSTQVICAYSNCNSKMLAQNLKQHTKYVHGSKFTISQGQSTLDSFFGSGQKRTNNEANSEEAGNKKKKMESKKDNVEKQNHVFMVDESVKVEESCDDNANVKETATEDEKPGGKPEMAVSKLIPVIEQVVKRAVEEVLSCAVNIQKEKVEVVVKETKDVVKELRSSKDVMKDVRTIKEICLKFPTFEHKPDSKDSEFSCIVCSTSFSYSNEEDQDFQNSTLPRKFRNLKTHLLSHLELDTHIEKAEKEDAIVKVQLKKENRNKAIGLTLGRIVYHMVHKGLPDTHYTALVYLSAAGGSDCGDLNHSEWFLLGFFPHLADAVRGRLKAMLETRLVATGCLPPVCLIADKATHQRETRQLVGGITLNPGGPELLVPLLFGIPKCAGGSGQDLCDNIVEAATPFIAKEQVKN